MLNADQLGEKGQARFKEICADACLICNKSDRDLAGWDFIVEFEFEDVIESKIPLEIRKVPLSCHVQVKTLIQKNDRFKLRLSSAERLAKELKPAFICVLKVDEDLVFVDAYLIHILSGPLEKILKRLRKEDVSGNSTPNKNVISMSASAEGLRIAPKGENLRQALISAIGLDLHAYVSEKQRQLLTLGFEERPYTTEMTLDLSNEDFVDLFLGLKRDVSAHNLRAEHTRFGISTPLPELADKDVKISIDPSPVDTCTIIVRGEPLSRPVSFRGLVFFPAIPELPREYRKILLKTDLFYIVLYRDRLSIKSEPPSLLRLAPSIWAAYWRLAFVMATGDGAIQVISDNLAIKTTLNIRTKISELNQEQCGYLMEICEQASFLLELAGVPEEPKLDMETILKRGKEIQAAYRLARPGEKAVTFSFASDVPSVSAEVPLKCEVIYADCIGIGGVTIGYYGLMDIMGTRSEDKISWKSSGLVLKRMAQLLVLPRDFDQMVEDAQKETGCQGIIRGYSSPRAL